MKIAHSHKKIANLESLYTKWLIRWECWPEWILTLKGKRRKREARLYMLHKEYPLLIITGIAVVRADDDRIDWQTIISRDCG